MSLDDNILFFHSILQERNQPRKVFDSQILKKRFKLRSTWKKMLLKGLIYWHANETFLPLSRESQFPSSRIIPLSLSFSYTYFFIPLFFPPSNVDVKRKARGVIFLLSIIESQMTGGKERERFSSSKKKEETYGKTSPTLMKTNDSALRRTLFHKREGYCHLSPCLGREMIQEKETMTQRTLLNWLLSCQLLFEINLSLFRLFVSSETLRKTTRSCQFQLWSSSYLKTGLLLFFSYSLSTEFEEEELFEELFLVPIQYSQRTQKRSDSSSHSHWKRDARSLLNSSRLWRTLKLEKNENIRAISGHKVQSTKNERTMSHCEGFSLFPSVDNNHTSCDLLQAEKWDGSSRILFWKREKKKE